MTTWSGPLEVTPVSVHDAEAETLLRTYFADVASRYYGRPATEAELDEAMAEDPSDELAPPHGTLLLARLDGAAVACAGLRRHRDGFAELKRMFVLPGFRGRGIAALLLAAIERAARELGVSVIRLDTRADLVEARRLYAKHGYREIPAYNAEPYAEHWFEKKLS
ncbi:GNAT family N-acetyltransferase [Prauserella endophytica]|uniref:GNAT family N-acetyltransferase n=1 Tax=Prauserella endophytica TaxID=1592324 RepID=A0ABY2RY60_9PSEU|nr:GNAT family N-acetyltransferase [Prauserella endophytica]PXY19819.1 GCN5 family acetyltransferase [Prauserella coralliicola]TKG64275.1 GNAT family N-acetyltransferase [Prauserella endophytica]